ncbi:MAG: TerB family tellurite resistance protein [Methylococcaceae bacterium]|nr:TerB family tellurite resistance protein [Methylococcaceae bacterium]
MSDQSQKDWFNNVESVVTESLKFKAKLAIGEDAYTSLKLKNAALEAWDTIGVATTAATVAKSSVIASTFFAPSGFLAWLGIGTAVTPIGWVIAAGLLTGGAWLGITHHLKNASTSRVTVIPNFINTPIDVLALGLFDLLAPLALKVANIDENIDETERKLINTYFVKEWGYDQRFVDEGLAFIEDKLSDFEINKLTIELAEFKMENPDCNYKAMSQDILEFLKDIMEADGRIDAREEMAIESVQKILKVSNLVLIGKKIKKTYLVSLNKILPNRNPKN